MKTAAKLAVGLMAVGLVLVGVRAWGTLPVFWPSATGYQARGPVTFGQLAMTYSATVQNGVPQTDGTFGYCSDCKVGANNVCVGAGSGSAFERVNGVWICGLINAGVVGSVPDPLSLNRLIGIGSVPEISGFNTAGYYDPSAYGVSFSVAAYAGSLTSGSTTVGVVNGPTDYVAGEGVVIPNAGAACDMNTTCPQAADPTVYQVNSQVAYVPNTSHAVTVGATVVADGSETDSPTPAADGSAVTFGGTVANTTGGLEPSTFSIQFGNPSMGIVMRAAGDPSASVEQLVGYPGASGTINDSTGVWSVTLPYAPATGTTFLVGYQYDTANNCTGDAGAYAWYNNKPYTLTAGALSTGKYQFANVGGACTYTFFGSDGKQPVMIRYATSAPLTGVDSVCVKVAAKGGTWDGMESPASNAVCLSNINWKDVTELYPLYILPTAYTDAKRYVIYQKDTIDWQANHLYALPSTLPAIVMPTSGNAGEHVFTQNVSACTSGAGPVTWCQTSGCVQSDGGTCTWKEVGVNDYYIAGGKWAADPIAYYLNYGGPWLKNAWHEENTPVTPPVAAVNDDLQTTVATVAANSLVLAAAPGITGTAYAFGDNSASQTAGMGTIPILHSDDLAWQALQTAVGTQGGEVRILNKPDLSAISRVHQWIWQTNGFGMNIRGASLQNSEILAYGDGGGLCTTATNGPFSITRASGGEIAFLNLLTNNSAADCVLNNLGTFNTSNFNTIQVTGAANWNNSTGIRTVGMGGNTMRNVVIKRVVRDWLMGTVITSQFEGGSYNLIWPGNYLHAAFEALSGGMNNVTWMSSVDCEVCWNVIRAVDATATIGTGNSMAAGVADVSTAAASVNRLNGETMITHGAFVDWSGNGGTIGPFTPAFITGQSVEEYAFWADVLTSGGNTVLGLVSKGGNGMVLDKPVAIESAYILTTPAGTVGLQAHDNVEISSFGGTGATHTMFMSLGTSPDNTTCAGLATGAVQLGNNTHEVSGWSVINPLICSGTNIKYEVNDLNIGHNVFRQKAATIADSTGTLTPAAIDLDKAMTWIVTVPDNTAWTLPVPINVQAGAASSLAWTLVINNTSGVTTGTITTTGYKTDATWTATINSGKRRVCAVQEDSGVHLIHSCGDGA